MNGYTSSNAGQFTSSAAPPSLNTAVNNTTGAWSSGSPLTPSWTNTTGGARAASRHTDPMMASSASSTSSVTPPAVAERQRSARTVRLLVDTDQDDDAPLPDLRRHTVDVDGDSGSNVTGSTGGGVSNTTSLLSTQSVQMTGWRGGERGDPASREMDHMGSRNASQVFDPTEVPVLKYTMSIRVTRDGKVVEEELDPYEVARLYGQQQAALRSLQTKYDFLSVPDWVRVHPLLGTYLAEFIGSFAWVLTLALVSVRNESIFTVADDTNMTPIPIGFMFTSMIFTFGYVSSAHFNPAVSVAVFLIRRMDLGQCFAYVLSQLAGAFLAGIVSMLIQGSTDIFVPSVSSSYITSGIFSELIFTFAICVVVLNIAYSRQSGNFFYGFAVGMTITAGSASVGRISGGAFNPAAATGLQLAMCMASNCDDLKSVWIYWIAPLIGAVAAALLYSQMVQPTDTQVLEDNKVFQDVQQLQRQRSTAGGHGRGASSTAHSSSAEFSTSSSSDDSSSDADRGETHASSPPPTPTAAAVGGGTTFTATATTTNETYGWHTDSGTPDVPSTRSPRQASLKTREETEAATTVQMPENESNVDNWRRRPPPRREDTVEAEEEGPHEAATNWF